MKVTTAMGNCSVGNCKCNHNQNYEFDKDADSSSVTGGGAGGGSGEDVDGDASGSGSVVVVGVKMDSRSKELLTWALVKVANSGDRVIVVHVIDPKTEDKTSLLLLVKTFDSVLAAYDGFCNLKQVDLKLKVSRGSPVRKVLAQEAVSQGAMSLIVGTSRTQRPMHSAVAVAKYCARSVGQNISVTAVNNGKILFHREAAPSVGFNLQCFHAKEFEKGRKETVNDNLTLPKAFTRVGPSSQLSSSSGGEMGDSLALVPFRNQEKPEAKARWALLRKVLVRKQKVSAQSPVKKRSVMHWILKLPSQKSFAVVSPVQEQNDLNNNLNIGCDDLPISHPSTFSVEISPKELEGLSEKYSSVCRLFSYQELLTATSNFKAENMIGKGGSSQVYKGSFPDGMELAVKILKPAEDVFQQFVSEIDIITSVNHRNIITLVGFCIEDNNLLLVYELLSRGSLEDNLHGNQKISNSFGLEERFKVALGVAEALEHLHNEATEPIIHRDVKSSNILLSDDFDPKLADFGLAVLSSSSSHPIQSIDVAGTFGYLAPEYFMHGKVIDKIDIYAFGVVLLELLSGKKPIDNGHPKGPESLITWAKQILKEGKVCDLLDSSLKNSYDSDQIDKMVLAASLCIRRCAQSRPSVGIVRHFCILQGIVFLSVMLSFLS
ncbi:OLC1v1001238C2 [Oldenlandia corymbosa var. corymbosa]|uniref:OLC1v1001238C2 n=1 Tax=Oldenlandia corymbosa var. corymbosa TaxID=529605 RepID=A0AAV1D5L3_OLDCO|nr:OLC1v1001238C2 [Oldenlandia corymbosa var. corymbosa]